MQIEGRERESQEDKKINMYIIGPNMGDTVCSEEFLIHSAIKSAAQGGTQGLARELCDQFVSNCMISTFSPFAGVCKYQDIRGCIQG